MRNPINPKIGSNFSQNIFKDSIINVLGVVYAVLKTSDGGDLYLTEYGIKYSEHLDPLNWYEKSWFEANRQRLEGTSTVYYIPTKTIQGESVELVAKYSRVGEDVPLNTFTMSKFLASDFNSPWEEFSLVFEMRDGKFGPKEKKILTQEPLGIYIPPDVMQLWQSGRSENKIRKIKASHPEIELDILRQYMLLYRWIPGKNIIELFENEDIASQDMKYFLTEVNNKSLHDMEVKGYEIHDMKPQHIVISSSQVNSLPPLSTTQTKKETILNWMNQGDYSVIDYELLYRTEKYQEEFNYQRRHHYLDDQRDRFIPQELPSHIQSLEIFGVPYVYSIAESTGGELWVVGKNPRLVDYFLPERWRSTPKVKLSENKEIYLTITKDKVRLVWKVSSVGEKPEGDPPLILEKMKYGYNSPFEEFAIALELDRLGIPVVYVRAIYRTGSRHLLDPDSDYRKFESHKKIIGADGEPVLKENHNYITIRGFYNGSDAWISKKDGLYFTPYNMEKAVQYQLIEPRQAEDILMNTIQKLDEHGYNGSLLHFNDILITFDPDGNLVKNSEGKLEGRICNFDFIIKNKSS